MCRKEARQLSMMKDLNELEIEREDIFIQVLHDQVSYIFDDCTIQFTSQNRLILCFRLQEKQNEKEGAYICKMENYEKKQEDLKKQLFELKTEQVSYIFGNCTIQFISPYRLACSSTGEKPDYLHVHKNNTRFT